MGKIPGTKGEEKKEVWGCYVDRNDPSLPATTIFCQALKSLKMSALDIAAVHDNSDVGLSGLQVHSPKPVASGSPEVLVPSSDCELALLALSYASPPMSASSVMALEFASSQYFPPALPEKLAFGQDLYKPLAPLCQGHSTLSSQCVLRVPS